MTSVVTLNPLIAVFAMGLLFPLLCFCAYGAALDRRAIGPAIAQSLRGDWQSDHVRAGGRALLELGVVIGLTPDLVIMLGAHGLRNADRALDFVSVAPLLYGFVLLGADRVAHGRRFAALFAVCAIVGGLAGLVIGLASG